MDSKVSALYKKVNRHVLPLLCLGYAFAFIDRINIGFAKLQMQEDLRISDAAYGLGAGLFFIGYMLFEVPSNLLLEKVGARKTFSRIMMLWGLNSAAMMFVYDARSFYILRFLLGVFEAGFAVGAVYYFTLWYPKTRMARTLAIFMSTPLLAGMMISPISTYLMVRLSGIGGLKGWQWLFLVEGLPCVILGLTTFWRLSDSPEEAKWLSTAEKRLLNQQTTQAFQHGQASFLHTLKDFRVYAMAFSLFCLACGLSVPFFWLPTLLKNAGVTDLMHIGLFTAVAYLCAIVAKFIFGISSDYY